MLNKKWIIIAGEEAGPKSNKMGGIWNVIDAEAVNISFLIGSGSIKSSSDIGIIVAGPYYDRPGSDWHKSLNRITNLSDFKPYDKSDEISSTINILQSQGMKIVSSIRYHENIPIIYIMFDTNNFCEINAEYFDNSMCLSNKVKSEAYDLAGINSLIYEKSSNGEEYTHYLNLSYAVSEFIKELMNYNNSSSNYNVLPSIDVHLHCHEFGLFYAIARLKKLKLAVNSVATYHATIPGRIVGHDILEKIRKNDANWPSNAPLNFTKLESLASYADVVTTVGEYTRKEIKLFYDIDARVIRNGIDSNSIGVDIEKKERCMEHIQKFLSTNITKTFGGRNIPPSQILPIFSLSRIEIDNKGYPELLDSLMLLDRIIKAQIVAGKLDENTRVACFIITAHGPKYNVPQGFPINLPDDILHGEEIRLQKMIKERKLEPAQLIIGKRHVCTVFYPQWISNNDNGFNMNADEIMAGCIAGIFPSKYEPFLLTGLEAGKESTPSIVSKVCGFSDALKSVKHLVRCMSGVIVVDNIDLPYNETIIDYALAMDYFLDTFVNDKVKYSLLCQEANIIANNMNWIDPVKEYYELLTGTYAVDNKS